MHESFMPNKRVLVLLCTIWPTLEINLLVIQFLDRQFDNQCCRFPITTWLYAANYYNNNNQLGWSNLTCLDTYYSSWWWRNCTSKQIEMKLTRGHVSTITWLIFVYCITFFFLFLGMIEPLQCPWILQKLT